MQPELTSEELARMREVCKLFETAGLTIIQDGINLAKWLADRVPRLIDEVEARRVD